MLTRISAGVRDHPSYGALFTALCACLNGTRKSSNFTVNRDHSSKKKKSIKKHFLILGTKVCAVLTATVYFVRKTCLGQLHTKSY